MTNGTPAITRTYQSNHLDSTRWQRFRPRPDHIVVATPYKSERLRLTIPDLAHSPSA
jgi:hypothetical protein